MIRTFVDARIFLETLIPLPSQIKPMQLERIACLCTLLGDPQIKYPIIHVGGTSGKGSTATFTATILTKLGLKMGLHLSPHLESVTERMQINNEPISESAFVGLVQHIESIINNSDIKKRFGLPTYFEFLVALSFFYFSQKKVHAAVVEVGLGGTLDGTNIIPPSVCILTNVSLDHTQILGKTVAKICLDKMGIIKKSAPLVVSGISQPRLQSMLIKRCKQLDVPLYLFNRDFGLRNEQLSLPGDFQQSNFTLAAVAASMFIKHFFPQKLGRVKSAIHLAAKNTFIPGRFEIVSKQPLTILDGAHNKAKMQAFATSVKHLYPKQQFISVVAVKADKAIGGMLNELNKITKQYIFTTFSLTTDFGPHLSSDPNSLATYTTKPNLVIKDPHNAVKEATDLSRKLNLPIIITGSLYLVGEVRKLWKHG